MLPVVFNPKTASLITTRSDNSVSLMSFFVDSPSDSRGVTGFLEFVLECYVAVGLWTILEELGRGGSRDPKRGAGVQKLRKRVEILSSAPNIRSCLKASLMMIFVTLMNSLHGCLGELGELTSW